jgi:hypothetical protein
MLVKVLTTCITNFYIEYVAFYHGMFTLCGRGGGCYSAYMCIPDRVTITDSDGMGRICYQVCMGFYGHGSSSLGNECSHPQGRGAGHAYMKNGSP